MAGAALDPAGAAEGMGLQMALSLMPGGRLVGSIFKRVKFVFEGKVGAGYLRIIKSTQKIEDHEISSSKYIAEKLGARVLHRGAGAKGPDLIINGDLWELKRLDPTGGGRNAIDGNIRKGIDNWEVIKRPGYPKRIIIDCRDIGWGKEEIRKGMEAVGGYRMQQVDQLRFIAKDGEIYEWPF